MYAAGANAVAGLQEDTIPVGAAQGYRGPLRVPQNCVISKRLLRSHSHWGTSAQKPSRGTGPAKAGRTSCASESWSTGSARGERPPPASALRQAGTLGRSPEPGWRTQPGRRSREELRGRNANSSWNPGTTTPGKALGEKE